MLALTQGMMGLGSVGGPELHWRILVSLTQTSDSFYAQVAEMQMRVTPGGSNVATGGTASAGSSFSSNPASNAFDGSTATSWATDGGVVPASGLIWLAYQFASPQDIVQIAITSGDNATRALRAPGTFQIQSSPNGTTWNTVWTVTGSTGWGITETRVFTKP